MATARRSADPAGAASSWRLPAVPERAAPWLRILWIALAFAAVVATCAGPFLHARERAEFHRPFFELGLRQSEGRTLETPHSEALRRRGVVAGSELIAVAGRTVPQQATFREVARMLSAVPGPAVPVTIRSPDGTERSMTLRRSPTYIEEGYRGSGLNYLSRLVIDLGFAGITNFVLIGAATLLFWRRPRDGLAALLSFSLLLWAATENLSWYTWWRLGFPTASGALSSLAFVAMLICLLLFPDGQFRPRWGRWVAAALVAGGLFINADLVGVDVPFLWRVMPMLAIDCVAIAAVIVRYRRTPAGTVEKQQEKWLALGLVAAVFWLLTSVLLQILPNFFPDNPRLLIWCRIGSGITFSAVTFSIAASLLVALLRYRLYDAEAAISRSASVAILTLIFGAVFAGSAKGLELAFEAYFGADTGALPGVLAAVLATMLVTPAQSRIQSWTTNRFQRELAHLRRDLPDCVNDLREVADLDQLLDEVLERVESGVRSSQSAVVVGERIAATRGISRRDARSWLAERERLGALDMCDRSDSVFPMRVPLAIGHSGGDAEAWLLLGPRPDGSFYRREEQEALAEVADPVARAIRLVSTRQARERLGAAERESMMSVLTDLVARVERLEQGQQRTGTA